MICADTRARGANVRPRAGQRDPARSDLETLFDRGYVTITPDYRLEVSRRIRDEFEDGRDYSPARSGSSTRHLTAEL